MIFSADNSTTTNNNKKKKNRNDRGNENGKNSNTNEDKNKQPAPQRITGKKLGMSVNTQIKLVDKWRNISNNNNNNNSENLMMTKLNSSGNAEKKKSNNSSSSGISKSVLTSTNTNENDLYQAELKRRRAAAQEKRRVEREMFLQKSAIEANDGNNLGTFFDADFTKRTVCFVDGYNVCGVADDDETKMRVSERTKRKSGGIKGLRRKFLVDGDLDGARRILEEKVKAFAISRNMECVIVWDNNNYHVRGGAGGGGNSNSNSNSTNNNNNNTTTERIEDIGNGVTVVFTGNGQLADGYIERETKLISQDKEKENNDVYVVTSDVAVRIAVSSANARVIDSSNFCTEIRETERDEDAILRELALDARWGGSAKQNKASIGASVLGDASIREQMMKLRESARNTAKAEMDEKLTGKNGSFTRFKQQQQQRTTTTTTTTNISKQLIMRNVIMDEKEKKENLDGKDVRKKRWGNSA